jgi:hypothetical protein
VVLTTDAIRARLADFVAKWSGYDGSEKAGAQEYLIDLMACYGQTRESLDARFEQNQGGKFMDMFVPGLCIFEMKRPSEAEKLGNHQQQAFDYWQHSADAVAGIEAARYVVLSAFGRMEIWEPGRFPQEPRRVLALEDLPENLEALQFLAGRQPVFRAAEIELTRDAVRKVAGLNNLLVERGAGSEDEIRNFVFQCVWCLFAEDVGMLPDNLFSRLIEGLRKNPDRSSADDIGQLFTYLNRSEGGPAEGLYKGVPYANGGLFERPAAIHLTPEELELLAEAALARWQDVEPAIFGGLLEGGLEHEQQWHLGAHYTHLDDIKKIVEPTISRPWRERIAALGTVKEAEQARADLLAYKVLDPACGSGNFLYFAYRELRRISKELADKIHLLRRKEGLAPSLDDSYFPLSNIRGIEIDTFAVALARVTLWMGHKLSVDELGLSERSLPLTELSGIRQADALRIEWPETDAIIGNPPFHGSQNIRGEFGDAYVEFLKREFNVGVKDFCVYWFRKANDVLAPGQRAGLVGTNSISQNRARSASLEYVAQHGGVITDAVSSQRWPGEAKVHVSIVNWIKQPAEPPTVFTLDGVEVDSISPSLRAGGSHRAAEQLAANAGRCFQGPIPVGDGFVLEREEAEALLAADPALGVVIRPYVIGDDIASIPGCRPGRWIIDFNDLPLEEAQEFGGAMKIVRDRVKPVRETNRDERFRKYWWRFGRTRGELRDALDGLGRFVVGTATGKRILFAWQDAIVCPSNLTNVFAFEDDYSLGVLTSCIHTEWARTQSSTLETRIRYTPTSAFVTFPWPTPTDQQRARIAEIAKALYDLRDSISLERQIGLTKLYNDLEDGAFQDLAKLHRQLDEAVADAYGWPGPIARDHDETNARLLRLNHAIADGETDYAPFTYLKRGDPS